MVDLLLNTFAQAALSLHWSECTFFSLQLLHVCVCNSNLNYFTELKSKTKFSVNRSIDLTIVG